MINEGVKRPLTAPTSYAGILQVANAFLNCAPQKSGAKYFAFAIQFTTFNRVFRLRQVSASNPPQRKAAKR